MKIKFLIYILTYQSGNVEYTVCNEPGDNIQICRLSDNNNREVYFESEGYHLSGWCEYNKIKLTTINKLIDV